jgi:threonine dehydratase
VWSTGSAGNHGQALAFAAAIVGVPCEIFVPRAPRSPRSRRAGATAPPWWQGGDSLDEAVAAAHDRATEAGMTFCHPYDDPVVVAGQGTLGLELAEDHPDLRC